MATFAKSNFSFAGYAAFRPVYPQRLYERVLAYHDHGPGHNHGKSAPRAHCVDLGCGHGVITRAMAEYFSQVTGTDPSEGMIKQAQASTASTEYPNVSFRVSPAESLPFLADGSVDAVVSGQAAHWFDYARFFPEVRRVLRKGGTLALWGYKDPVFPDYPKASKILDRYSYEDAYMGPYWTRPGRTIVQEKYRAIVPPPDAWADVQRIEYEPSTSGPGSGEGDMFLQRQTDVAALGGYVRTFSCFHGWMEANPDRTSRDEGGPGDLTDQMLDEMKEAEGWTDDLEITVEWGSGLILARRN